LAIWQFDLHVLPCDAVKAAYGDIRPLTLSKSDFEKYANWDECHLKDIEGAVASLLEERSSWGRHLRTWGDEDGNRIDLTYQAGILSSIFVRIDVRTVSYTFIGGFLDVARRNDWVLLTGDGRLLDPSASQLLSAIQRSTAAKFVADPEQFLKNLGERLAENRGQESKPEDR